MRHGRIREGGKGFSLVEVVLAIGILSFAILALIGLFSVGMAADQDAAEDTAFASMVSQVMGHVRNEARRGMAGLPADYQFDISMQSVAASDPEAFYDCRLAYSNVTGFPEVSPHLKMAVLTFTWPASVPAASRPNTNIIYATLSVP